MHQVRRTDVFPPGEHHVVAERHHLSEAAAPHSHDFHELAVVTGGTAVHVSGAGERPLARGSVVLLRPGDWHGYRACADLVVHNVYLGSEVLGHELAWLRADFPFAPAPHDPVALPPLTGAALALAESSLTALAAGGAPRTVRVGLLLCVLGGALPPGSGAAARPHPALTAAVRLLEQDVAAAWTVERLAGTAGLSPGRLARLFTRGMGVPPMAYLARLRAERAAALLIETDLPVAAVGRRVGWPDPNYASRRFRHHFGLSPARYRERFRA
ncbi:AraC family transcriptional regulator [Streptomyces hainanensis]|uniref:AraC family transcriptional regulator n=1 Tax=Streptomyces hainanensis TaxID=402648 RepID=A0A4R4SL98_9ACTN|nr:AraC family transcriptional regulator [Streptomyces hainanensis]TDC64411.1 AraC family transcriptional regulator [Streptomyces hainanensis]